jgi:hypothetical protein
MNVEIGAEALLFPENEYISGIFVAVKKKYGKSTVLGKHHVTHLVYTVSVHCEFGPSQYRHT